MSNSEKHKDSLKKDRDAKEKLYRDHDGHRVIVFNNTKSWHKKRCKSFNLKKEDLSKVAPSLYDQLFKEWVARKHDKDYTPILSKRDSSSPYSRVNATWTSYNQIGRSKVNVDEQAEIDRVLKYYKQGE